MSTHTASRELRLFTLSPLHIGTGESLSPMDYVVDGDRFYRLQQEELYQLVRSEQFPEGPRRLMEWTQAKFREMRDLRDNRKQSHLMNRTNARTFFRDEQQEGLLMQYLRQRQPGGQQLIFDDDNRHRRSGEYRLGEVREAIRTGQDKQPYLPGTSIKGAIRTALLYDYLQRHGDFDELERLIEGQLNQDRRPRPEYFAAPLEAAVFFCKQREKREGRGGKPPSYRVREQEAQMDLLKYLAVSDAHQVGSQRLSLDVGKINLYLVEKERGRNKQPTGRLLAARQGQSSYAEMIARGQQLVAKLTVDSTALVFLLQQAQKGGIVVGEMEYYLQLRSKLQRLFNLSDAVLDQADSEALGEAIITHCLVACQRFAQAQLQRQQEWQDDYGSQDDPDNYAPRIAAGFAPVRQYGGQMMHLGYAAGFNATTVLLHFLRDQPHRKLYERIMRLYQLGRAPRQKGAYNPKISRFPKSRRFVEAERSIQPLGWLAILGSDEALPALSTPAGDSATGGSSAPSAKEAAPSTPEFFTGRLNYKKPPNLDAVVVKPGSPNQVQVYYIPDQMPMLDLRGYRTPLEVGTVIVVKTQFNKRGQLLSVSYLRAK